MTIEMARAVPKQHRIEIKFSMAAVGLDSQIVPIAGDTMNAQNVECCSCNPYLFVHYCEGNPYRKRYIDNNNDK